MRRPLFFLLIAFVMAAPWTPRLCVMLLVADDQISKPSADDVIASLQRLEGKSLESYLSSLSATITDLDHVSIDGILVELQRIESTDPFEEPRQFKGKSIAPEFVNRKAARAARHHILWVKSLEDLRSMTIEVRANHIMDVMEGKRSLPDGASPGCYWEVLRSMGNPILPLVLNRAPTHGQLVEMYTSIVSSFSGTDADRYLIKVLRETSNDGMVRCNIIRLLDERAAKEAIPIFIDLLRDSTNEEMVRCDIIRLFQQREAKEMIPIFVELLRDSHVRESDRCVSQSVFESDRHPCVFQDYPIRQCAAAALSLMTEKDWGPIFFDDYRTWTAWRDAPDRSKFNPLMLARSEVELEALARHVLHRQMTYHALRTEEDYETPWATQVGRQLRPLGVYAVEVVLDEFRERAPKMKNDKSLENLQLWAAQLLSGIDLSAARQTEEEIMLYERTYPESP